MYVSGYFLLQIIYRYNIPIFARSADIDNLNLLFVGINRINQINDTFAPLLLF